MTTWARRAMRCFPHGIGQKYLNFVDFVGGPCCTVLNSAETMLNRRERVNRGETPCTVPCSAAPFMHRRAPNMTRLVHHIVHRPAPHHAPSCITPCTAKCTTCCIRSCTYFDNSFTSNVPIVYAGPKCTVLHCPAPMMHRPAPR